MEKIKRIYYYIFYVLYKNAKKSPTIFPYDFVAGISMIALEIWSYFSFLYYYSSLSNIKLNLSFTSPIILIPFLFIIGLNYFTFIHYDNIWKEYNKEFDGLSQETNRKYKIIVWIGIVLLIINLIYSVYYMDQHAKKNQTGPYTPELVAKERREDSLQKAQQIEKLKRIYGEDKR